MRMKLFVTIFTMGCLIGLPASAFAQGASSVPQTYNPQLESDTTYLSPVSPRLFDQARLPQVDTGRNHHRGSRADHASSQK
jgi:hypothetical protein